jgi:hypothetical protein
MKTLKLPRTMIRIRTLQNLAERKTGRLLTRKSAKRSKSPLRAEATARECSTI